VLLAQAFAAQHSCPSGGRIVLLTSGQHRSAMLSELAYAVSKGAIHQLTGTLDARRHHRQHGQPGADGHRLG
jgi:3-oxoacyl-[acyl-carrier protein] reductase